MKHFIKKHRHHFGLWALSAIILILSLSWFNHLNKQELTSSRNVLSSGEADTPPTPPAKSQKELPAAILSKLAAELVSGSAVTSSISSTNVQEEAKINAIFKISTPAQSRELNVFVPLKSTVYDALNLLSKEKKISVEFKDFAGLGAMVQSIDGLVNDANANKFWIYYINGQSAQIGISAYIIKPNDLIEWKYEASKF